MYFLYVHLYKCKCVYCYQTHHTLVHMFMTLRHTFILEPIHMYIFSNITNTPHDISPYYNQSTCYFPILQTDHMTMCISINMMQQFTHIIRNKLVRSHFGSSFGRNLGSSHFCSRCPNPMRNFSLCRPILNLQPRTKRSFSMLPPRRSSDHEASAMSVGPVHP